MKTKRSPRATRRRLILLTVAILATGILMFPVYWMIMTSLVPSSELLVADPPLVPPAGTASLDAWRSVLTEQPVARWLLNSTLTTAGVAGISTVVSILGGYSLSRFQTAGQRAMGFTLLLSRMLPGTLLIIPLFILFARVHLVNNLWSVTLVNIAATVPFTTWLMKGFVDAIPEEMEQAAMIDGCGRLSTLWHVVVPSLKPGIAATFTYAAILGWGDFLFARTLMGDPQGWTITVGIASFIGEFSVDWSGLMAMGLMSTIPMIILFIVLEPFLSKGMAAGAVKG